MSRNKDHNSNVYFGARLRIFRKHLRLNVEQFSGLLGISQSSLSAVENNKTKTSSQTIVNLVHNTDINVYWLFSGKGKMLREKDTEEAFLEKSLEKDSESDLITKTVEILKSESIYKAALIGHINAILSSIRTQETMNKRVVTLEKQIAKLMKNRHPSDSS